jgi:hypothetical protein
VIKKHLSVSIFIYSCLFFIFIIALLLRFYHLDLNQPPLYADETGGHYLLYHQLRNTDPNYFVNLYNQIFLGTFSLTWLFGLTPLGVRAASAIYGSLGIIAIFAFAKSIKTNHQPSWLIGLIAAIVVTSSPWNYNLSRLGHTHVPIIILLICLHLYLYFKAVKINQYFLSLLPLFISLLYYPSTVILTAGGLIPVLIEIWKISKKNQKMVAINIFVAFFVIIAVTFIYRFNGLSLLSRGLDLAIWRDVNLTADSNLYRGLARNSSPSIFTFNLEPEALGNKLVYNFPISVVNIFLRNYLSFFSPDFLFLKGDPVLRHSTGQVGAFLPFLFPFMLFGSFIFFKNANNKTRNIFLIWILISPIPAALTKDGAGYLLRAVTLMPFLAYFCALGIVESINIIRQQLLRCLFISALALIALFSAYYYLYGYFQVYPSLSEKSFEAGFKELSDFQLANNNKSMLVIWDGYYPHFHFRFWQKTPYEKFQKFSPQVFNIQNSQFHQTYNNLFFSLPKNNQDLDSFIHQHPIDFLVLPQLFLSYYPKYQNINAKPMAIINYPDQTPAFYIYNLHQ